MKKNFTLLTLLILLFGPTVQGADVVHEGLERAKDLHCSVDCNTLSCKSFHLFKLCQKECDSDLIENCTASFCKGCGKSRCKDSEAFEYCKKHCGITQECTASFCQQCKMVKGPKKPHQQTLCQENCPEKQSTSEDDSKENDAEE